MFKLNLNKQIDNLSSPCCWLKPFSVSIVARLIAGDRRCQRVYKMLATCRYLCTNSRVPFYLKFGSLDESQLLPDDEPLVEMVCPLYELSPDKCVDHACHTLVVALLWSWQLQHPLGWLVGQALAIFLQLLIITHNCYFLEIQAIVIVKREVYYIFTTYANIVCFDWDFKTLFLIEQSRKYMKQIVHKVSHLTFL